MTPGYRWDPGEHTNPLQDENTQKTGQDSKRFIKSDP